MTCNYCGAEIEGTAEQRCHYRAKPSLFWCNQRCYVFDAMASFPGSALDGMIRTAYPELAAEFDKEGGGTP